MGNYWAEIAEKNQTEKQIQFLKTHLKPEAYVLDLACGSGRHSISLSQLGFCMVGLDISLKLLRIAKKHLGHLQVVRGDMRHLPFKAGAFSAALSMDTSFGYLPSELDDKVSLAEVRGVLCFGGVFVVDVFNQEKLAVRYKKQNSTIKEIEYPSFVLQQKRTVSNDGKWLCDSWTTRDKAFGKVMFFNHKVRLFGKDELQSLLVESGFEVEMICGGYEGEELSAGSPRLILIVR